MKGRKEREEFVVGKIERRKQILNDIPFLLMDNTDAS
jgi:hypothetical protein